MGKTLPRNSEIADQFDLLADFLELEGSDQFRPLAYRRAAQRMRESLERVLPAWEASGADGLGSVLGCLAFTSHELGDTKIAETNAAKCHHLRRMASHTAIPRRIGAITKVSPTRLKR